MTTFGQFKTSIDVVPSEFASQFIQLTSAISSQHTCGSCGRRYGGFDVGTLGCSYHPFEYTNQAQRFDFYDALSPQPTDCRPCNSSHLDSYARRAMNYRIPGDDDRMGQGCTPIDHAGSVDEILRKPFACVPLAMANKFTLHDFYDSENPMSMLDRNNVLVIHKPEQMALSVSLSIPGTGRPFIVPVVHLYEEVREVFQLEDLQKTVRIARRGPNASSITRIKGMQHPDALDVYRLYANDAEANAEFMPFAVLARVHQAQPMQLLDLPHLVNVLDDDDLV